MGVRIIIAGESSCDKFAQISLIADHLSQTLPCFCYERIEKSIIEWKIWLAKINQKNKWHHTRSPLVWKELLMKGSKPFYIGGTSEFLDYCHSYYQFDYFMADSKFEGLIDINSQYHKKVKLDTREVEAKRSFTDRRLEVPPKSDFIVCISCGGNQLTMQLIAELLELAEDGKSISKLYLFDNERPKFTMQTMERDCSYIGTNYPGKVVKYCEKIGVALANCDLFIILDHVRFDIDAPIGDWLQANRKVFQNFALMINASAKHDMRVLLPNLGPACHNATVLMHSVSSIRKKNVVVSTSDLGLEVAPIIASIAEIPMRNMFCPPVWGFVGINHLVDVRTTIHKYNRFTPYKRYTKVKNSTLNIGSYNPEMRTMEYLLYFDETLWTKVVEQRAKVLKGQVPINKAISLVNFAKLWLFGPKPDEIVSLGVKCNGSFGLNFDGIFSQPSRFVNGYWEPAGNYLMPRDSQMKLPYLEQMAKFCMGLEEKELPNIIAMKPCICRRIPVVKLIGKPRKVRI